MRTQLPDHGPPGRHRHPAAGRYDRHRRPPKRTPRPQRGSPDVQGLVVPRELAGAPTSGTSTRSASPPSAGVSRDEFVTRLERPASDPASTIPSWSTTTPPTGIVTTSIIGEFPVARARRAGGRLPSRPSAPHAQRSRSHHRRRHDDRGRDMSPATAYRAGRRRSDGLAARARDRAVAVDDARASGRRARRRGTSPRRAVRSQMVPRTRRSVRRRCGRVAASTEAHYDLALAGPRSDRPVLVEKPSRTD